MLGNINVLLGPSPDKYTKARSMHRAQARHTEQTTCPHVGNTLRVHDMHALTKRAQNLLHAHEIPTLRNASSQS